MAHRRSGAQRRAIQKQRLGEAAAAAAADNSSDEKQTTVETSPAQAPVTRNYVKQPPLTPATHEVMAAIASLYMDELKPFGRLLKKRIAERWAASKGKCAADSAVQDVDVKHLHSVCEACDELDLQPEEGGDWSVTLIGCPVKFVDVYSNEDPYPEEMWAKAATYFDTTDKDEMTLPGGRYSCAQTLQSRGMPFLQGLSLGAISHIVQLAISEKKLLGYLNGFVVSYARSHSMIKQKNASQGSALTPNQEAIGLPFASLGQARLCLRKILQDAASEKPQGPGMIPLSNVKRTFRATFQLELSETMLGHSKLSELLQDSRFKDICSVRLDCNGYSVIQAPNKPSFIMYRSKYSTPSPVLQASDGLIDDSLEPRKLAFCPDEPLCIDDACEPTLDQPLFGPTPGPFEPTPTLLLPPALKQPTRLALLLMGASFPLPMASQYPTSCASRHPWHPVPFATMARPTSVQHDPMLLAQFLVSARVAEPLDHSSASTSDSKENDSPCSAFCVDEPLCLDDAVPEIPDTLTFGETPCPFEPTPTLLLPPVLETRAPTPTQPTRGSLLLMGESFPLPLGYVVHNTFIHAPPAPPTPVPSIFRRCASMPTELLASGSSTSRSCASQEDEVVSVEDEGAS